MNTIGRRTKAEQLVTFRIADEEYGIPITDVYEIIFVPAITSIAKAPKAIIGVINLRGQIIPVLDLRVQFERAPETATKKRRIIVARVGGTMIGLLVDQVTEVLRTDRAAVEEAPDSLVSLETAYLAAIYKLDERVIVLLDMEQLLFKHEQEALAGAIGQPTSGG